MAAKGESPNRDIDKAIKDLLSDARAENMAPDVIRAKAAAITVAVNWEKTKFHIKDEEDFNPDN